MAPRVFVSHSHKDAAWCDPFVDALAGYSIDIWYDRKGLYAGAQWVRTIEDELSSRDVFLVVITPESWASEWVREELALALASQKRVVGVVAKPTQVSGFILQRQMLEVTGQDAATAARTVAESLGVTKRSDHAAQETLTPYDPVSTHAQVVAPDLSGTWTQMINATPWILALEQVGTTLTGFTGFWNTPPEGRKIVVGSVLGGEVSLSFDDYLGIRHELRLHLSGGRLVGTDMVSGGTFHTSFETTFVRE